MNALEVAGFREWLQGRSLEHELFWRRDFQTIAPVDIDLLYAISSLDGLRDEAIAAVNYLQTLLIIQIGNGQLLQGVESLIMHEAPEEAFLSTDLERGLLQLEPVERHAVLFGLSSFTHIDRVISLTWSEVPTRLYDDLSTKILNQQTFSRLVKLPYVFHKRIGASDHIPLVDLAERAAMAFNMDWPTLQRKFGTMKFAPSAGDAERIIKAISTPRGN